MNGVRHSSKHRADGRQSSLRGDFLDRLARTHNYECALSDNSS